jgi:hypothetical protein
MRPLASIWVPALAIAAMAHVGSPDTFFTGRAGPYPIRVTVRLPGVIPGLAQVSIRIPLTAPESLARVTVQPIQWNLGPEGAPPADVAARVPGDSELYSADLWFMTATSYRVLVTVEGREGIGTATVPVVALATTQRPVPPGLGLLLSALGLLLCAGLVTIIGAAVREAALPPGRLPDAASSRRARLAMAVAAVVLAAGLLGGRVWWRAAAFFYGDVVLYRPFASRAVASQTNGRQFLTLTIHDRRWPPAPGNALTRYNALMPDHGKLMHMFIVREPDLDAFAHVHPVPLTTTAESFRVEVPPLPAGNYRIYADIVHESGYAQTLVAAAALAHTTESTSSADPDDSWWAGPVDTDTRSAMFRGQDGTTIVWERNMDRLVEGQEALLTFAIRSPDGSPAVLEPYMGMLGHVAVGRKDGSVFAHLHPAGSVSMAALEKFAGAPASLDPHTDHGVAQRGQLTIAYGFPKAGRYRLWVQVKRGGRVITGAFDADVEPAAGGRATVVQVCRSWA